MESLSARDRKNTGNAAGFPAAVSKKRPQPFHSAAFSNVGREERKIRLKKKFFPGSPARSQMKEGAVIRTAASFPISGLPVFFHSRHCVAQEAHRRQKFVIFSTNTRISCNDMKTVISAASIPSSRTEVHKDGMCISASILLWFNLSILYFAQNTCASSPARVNIKQLCFMRSPLLQITTHAHISNGSMNAETQIL